MNDNEGTIPQQIAHLESMATTMREDLAARAYQARRLCRPKVQDQFGVAK
jgi:hypothetical protein